MSLSQVATVVVQERKIEISASTGLPSTAELFTTTVNVYGQRTWEQSIREAAPDTEGGITARVQGMHKELPPMFVGTATKHLLLVCFGKFMHQARIEKWCKESGYTTSMNARALFAVAQVHNDFCRHLNKKLLVLVSLAPKVQHLGQSHVLTVHQKDTGDSIKRSVVLEPYDGGFGAHHLFGFEIPNKK